MTSLLVNKWYVMSQTEIHVPYLSLIQVSGFRDRSSVPRTGLYNWYKNAILDEITILELSIVKTVLTLTPK